MRTAMLAWAGRSVVSAIGRLSATEMKRSGIEVRKQTGTQSGRSRCGGLARSPGVQDQGNIIREIPQGYTMMPCAARQTAERSK